MPQPPPEECAVCGTALPRDARACPECGADERTGWRDASLYDGLDLPDAAFEGDESPPRPPLRRTLPWYWMAVGLVMLVALISLFVLR
jgi:hypothetical protein